MKVKILEGGFKPTRGTKNSAGIDVYAPTNIRIEAGRTQKIPLQIAIEIENDEVAIMSERSSMGVKGITSVGNIIDSDYRGVISIILQNNNNESWSANIGDRIGQIVICKLGDRYIDVVEELSQTERGDKGYGSTGK
jgi:dUTP pyrophosphatase